VATIRRALEHGQLIRENALLQSQVEDSPTKAARNRDGNDVEACSPLVGDSSVARAIREQVDRIASSQSTVLICGESGAGKEVVAQMIHQQSARRNKPMLAVNCAALSASLLESELFGHERGAFTGADKLRKGRFELADGGTLLLDEISEVPSEIQAKLLRVLQERAFERVGSSLSQCTDVRVIATTNRKLDEEVKSGRFREDLFYRLNVLPIVVPPLRDHREDVPSLCHHFLTMVAASEGRTAKHFDDDAIRILMAYHWPGNVRELGNICERACLFTEGDTILVDVVRPWLVTTPGTVGVESDVSCEVRPSRLSHFDHSETKATHAHDRHDGRSLSRSVPTAGYVTSAEPHPGKKTNGNGSHLTHLHSRPHFLHDENNALGLADDLIDANGSKGVSGTNGSTAHVQVQPGKSLEEIEREVIVATLHRNDGHRRRTARDLGIGVRTLGLKLRKWKDLRLVAQDL
jgi:transcriptional regulator with GAF, ATPase, and Fis domain